MFYSKSTGGFYLPEIHGTNIPADAVAITSEQHQALLAGQSAGKVIAADANGFPVLRDPPKPTAAEEKAAQIKAVSDQVQAHLDAKAKALGYDNIFTGVTYATEPAVPKFQNDGIALRAWRSLVWAKCYEVLAEIDAGTREPLDTAQLLALLPEFAQEQA